MDVGNIDEVLDNIDGLEKFIVGELFEGGS